MKDFRDWINNLIPGFGGYNAFYNIAHPWKPIRHCFRCGKWALQRVLRGYDDRATWDIDSYLADLIPKLVSELKENNTGVPCIMWDGMTPIDECYNHSEEDNKLASDKWDEILDKITKGFESYLEIDMVDNNSPEGLLLKSQFDEGFDLFRKYFRTLWD